MGSSGRASENVKLNGVLVGRRGHTNFSGSGVASITDDAANDELDIEVSGGGGASHDEDHDHDGSPTGKLAQANTHESPDTDAATTSLHHTIGAGATEAAAGDHSHDASAISIADAGGDFTATDVEGALDELQADNEAHLADTADAHDASTISFSPTGSIAATNVQTAIAEVASEAGGGGEAFPVGSVFISVVSTDPATLLGYGTWAAFATGRTLVGIDAGQAEFDTVEETGGATTHTLTEAEIPAHQHTFESDDTAGSNAITAKAGGAVKERDAPTAATGGGGAHNNLQPYIVVYMFKRTA